MSIDDMFHQRKSQSDTFHGIVMFGQPVKSAEQERDILFWNSISFVLNSTDRIPFIPGNGDSDIFLFERILDRIRDQIQYCLFNGRTTGAGQ